MTQARPLLLGILFANALALPALAQFDTAEVLGTIRDKSEAVVGKATVTLTNQDTGIEAKTESGMDGHYTFSNVKIGIYSVAAEASGFSKAVAKMLS